MKLKKKNNKKHFITLQVETHCSRSLSAPADENEVNRTYWESCHNNDRDNNEVRDAVLFSVLNFFFKNEINNTLSR